MKKILLGLVLTLFPLLTLAADGSLSFTPPAGDYSVVFLGNIFGVVDGVLHGTGSQMMGTIFRVFNSAVLALGGIIIIYTLIVSTMNTAHEGQMLGQKWSSIWVPIRSTVGLALLIPKASGYCLMQIFVMWVVVQGVGAADKVWDAALAYLNRGGVIVQAQEDPGKALTNAQSSGIASGAQTILAGQVCMLGLQKVLETQRDLYLQQDDGPCSGTVSPDMEGFCNTSVPDLINTVNAVSYQGNNPGNENFTVDMPYFDVNSTSPYAALRGICGTLHWNAYSSAQEGSETSETTSTLSESDKQVTQMSRAIAIQQMYIDLSMVARLMVNNDPNFSTTTDDSTSNNFSAVAREQFGVPYTSSRQMCSSNETKDCVAWGPVASDTNTALLLSGTEFQGAIADYDAVMTPTLTLAKQMQNMDAMKASRDFIDQASTRGWITAGSYFFDLVNLNQRATATNYSNLTDSNTGLNDSTNNNFSNLTASFTGNGSCSGPPCTWIGGNNQALVNQILALIQGGEDSGVTATTAPDLSSGGTRNVIQGGYSSSTVYGYTNNATIIQLPGQPGAEPLKFAVVTNFTPKWESPTNYLPKANPKSCWVKIFGTCVYKGGFVKELYNIFIVNPLNAISSFLKNIAELIIKVFIFYPVKGMQLIFDEGVRLISTPGINPIVGLAKMGTWYVNFASNLLLMMLAASTAAGIFSTLLGGLLLMLLPMVFAWLSLMFAVGFVTAYYVPILPYLIFTFGTIAWLIAVIEAMVAAPIVALGITHPEGHDAFGKGEQGIMILINVFLRPSMMIIGYIAGISLSYVGVWVLNSGFDHAIGFLQGKGPASLAGGDQLITPAGNIFVGYTGWAGIFGYFFSVLIYTTAYVVIVQKAFTLITYLPDKILRWIGGQPEGIGTEATQWGEEIKGKVTEAGKTLQDSQAAMQKEAAALAGKNADKATKKDASVTGRGKS